MEQRTYNPILGGENLGLRGTLEAWQKRIRGRLLFLLKGGIWTYHRCDRSANDYAVVSTGRIRTRNGNFPYLRLELGFEIPKERGVADTEKFRGILFRQTKQIEIALNQ